jgi:hypothetical protein
MRFLEVLCSIHRSGIRFCLGVLFPSFYTSDTPDDLSLESIANSSMTGLDNGDKIIVSQVVKVEARSFSR